jgi:hypothetical protein
MHPYVAKIGAKRGFHLKTGFGIESRAATARPLNDVLYLGGNLVFLLGFEWRAQNMLHIPVPVTALQLQDILASQR